MEMNSSLAFASGDVLEFDYPAANCSGVRLRWERRRVRVERVRDLEDEPLASETCHRDQATRRSRWLLTGFDFEKQARRSFYAESMIDVRRIEKAAPETEPAYTRSYSVAWTDGVPAAIDDDEAEDTPCAIIDILARGLTLEAAESLAETLNAACDDGPRAMVMPPGFCGA